MNKTLFENSEIHYLFTALYLHVQAATLLTDFIIFFIIFSSALIKIFEGENIALQSYGHFFKVQKILVHNYTDISCQNLSLTQSLV